VFYETQHHPSTETPVKPVKLVNAIHNEDWRAPIVAYLKGYLKLESKEEENRVSQRARGYKIIEGNLYKALVTVPLLKCVTANEGKQIL
jgi:hypothetical protein